jgi:hypothetical protein
VGLYKLNPVEPIPLQIAWFQSLRLCSEKPVTHFALSNATCTATSRAAAGAAARDQLLCGASKAASDDDFASSTAGKNLVRNHDFGASSSVGLYKLKSVNP